MNTALILRTWFAEGEFLDRSATAEDVARLKPSWVELTRQEKMDTINALVTQDSVYLIDAVDAMLKDRNT